MMNKHSISTPTDKTKRLEQKMTETQEIFPTEICILFFLLVFLYSFIYSFIIIIWGFDPNIVLSCIINILGKW